MSNSSSPAKDRISSSSSPSSSSSSATPSTSPPAPAPPPKGSSPSEPSEELFNLPNLLTLSRILCTPILGHLILTDQLLPATILLFVAGCTDVLDGWLARRWNAYTVFGSIADPSADKLMMAILVATLGWKGLLPPPLALLILSRDVALVLLAFRIRYITLPRPVTVRRYFNPRLPSAQVQPTQVSKYNTFLQLLSVGGALLVAVLSHQTSTTSEKKENSKLKPSFSSSSSSSSSQNEISSLPPTPPSKDWKTKIASILHYPLVTLWTLTAITTVWSGWGYFVGGAGYRNVTRRHRRPSILFKETRMGERLMREARERGRRIVERVRVGNHHSTSNHKGKKKMEKDE